MASIDENEQLVQEEKEHQLMDEVVKMDNTDAEAEDHGGIGHEVAIAVSGDKTDGYAVESPVGEEEEKETEEQNDDAMRQIADEVGGLSLDEGKTASTDAVVEPPVAMEEKEEKAADVGNDETSGENLDAENNESKGYQSPVSEEEHPIQHIDEQQPTVDEGQTHATVAAADSLPPPPSSEPTTDSSADNDGNNEIVSPTALEPQLVPTSDEEEQKPKNADEAGDDVAAKENTLSSGGATASDGTTVVAAFSAITPTPAPAVGQQQTEHQLSQHQQQAELCGAKTALTSESTARDSAEDETRKEKENLSARYEIKIDELRKQLEFFIREKAKLQIEIDKAQSGFEELKARVGKLEKDLRKAEKERTAAQADVQELTARFNNTDTALGNAEREIEQLRNEFNNSENMVDMLRRQLEAEGFRVLVDGQRITAAGPMEEGEVELFEEQRGGAGWTDVAVVAIVGTAAAAVVWMWGWRPGGGAQPIHQENPADWPEQIAPMEDGPAVHHPHDNFS
ncbi:hypothetical protein niasHS_010371 [Heterodera schachtii]|uniref:Uncharacterized protein n=1 Tax=Heterodera schachtii TaxID=97005 RepID=A0ABD2J1R0_HETSC